MTVEELEFVPRSGSLRGPAEALFAVATRTAGTASADEDWAALDAALEAAGAGTLTEPHPALRRSLEPISEFLVRIELERDAAVATMWVTPLAASLMSPLADGRAQLVSVPPVMVAAALARFFGVGPRPRAEGGAPVAQSPAELANAIASRRLGASVPDGPGRTALGHALQGLRSHWRATAQWLPAPGTPGTRTLEVVDTDAGMWLVVPDHPTVELWPTTPTTVAVQLCELLPRDEELDPT